MPRRSSAAMPRRSSAAMPRRVFLLASLLFLFAASIPIAQPHEHHGEDGGGEGCQVDPHVRVSAEYRPGLVTLDGHGDEWETVGGSEMQLLPALDPDEDKAYPGGKMTVKALHDGVNIFFLLQVDGDYAYMKGESKKCSSVALMFQIGEKATYQDMGGCGDMPGSCTSKSCRGHEVDIMHFSVGTAIPGRLYGSNPIDNDKGYGGDSFGHLVDLYAWNPHCRSLDGRGPSENNTNGQNDWQGAWWHSSISVHPGLIEEDAPYSSTGQKGTYYFEFSRPLRTRDHLQQDVQFTIGQPSNMAAAFWYPSNGQPWSGSQHFSGSCNWLPLDISPASSGSASPFHTDSEEPWDASTAFALLLSVISIFLSLFVGFWVTRSRSVPFTPITAMDRL